MPANISAIPSAPRLGGAGYCRLVARCRRLAARDHGASRSRRLSRGQCTPEGARMPGGLRDHDDQGHVRGVPGRGDGLPKPRARDRRELQRGAPIADENGRTGKGLSLPEELDEEALRSWVGGWRCRPSTTRLRLAQAKTFFAFAIEREWVALAAAQAAVAEERVAADDAADDGRDARPAGGRGRAAEGARADPADALLGAGHRRRRDAVPGGAGGHGADAAAGQERGAGDGRPAAPGGEGGQPAARAEPGPLLVVGQEPGGDHREVLAQAAARGGRPREGSRGSTRTGCGTRSRSGC